MDQPPSPKVSLPSIHEMFPEIEIVSQVDTMAQALRRRRRRRRRGVIDDRKAARGCHLLLAIELTLPHRGQTAAVRPKLSLLMFSAPIPRVRHSNIWFPAPLCQAALATWASTPVKLVSIVSPLPLSSSLPSSSHLASSTARQHAYQQPEPSNNTYIKDRASQPPPAAGPDSSSSTYPAIISFPVSAGSAASAAIGGASTNAEIPPADDGAMSEDEGTVGTDGPSNGKKHICPTCLKRFNRPSSLRIHVNTHTGATQPHVSLLCLLFNVSRC
ncbi:hypothetical protein EST38_g5898 [Candolleomyces aberdarensis]|uniref:C2H2-type domain-containing protein n=1 Tax=Candolleomyces aberdarensis TaxID=2316362 RepID=A0A4Q2DJ85_9AGAR|nr:hypothetical protein EST38_g5898 [Candolleomyces aberdarensis]